MANLKEAIEYASKNPTSPFAMELQQVIQSGAVDKEAETLGINLAPIKAASAQSTQATNPTSDGYLQRSIKGVKEGIQGAVKDITQKDGRSVGSRILSAGSNVANAVTAPVAELPGVKQVGELVGKGIEKAGEKLADTYSDEFQEDLASVSDEDFSQATQPLTDIQNASNIASTAIGAKVGVPKTISAAKTATKTAVKGAKSALDTATSVAKNISKYPSKIRNAITDTKIDPQVKTILDRTNVEKFDRYVEAGEKAVNDPSVLTPLEVAGETANNVVSRIKEDLNNIGRQKSATLESVRDIKAPDVTQEALTSLREHLQKKLTDSERKLVNQTIKDLEALGKNPTAQSVDATIDKLQSTVFERKGGTSIPVTSRTQSIVNSSIKNVNDKLKGFVDGELKSNDYSKLNLEWRNRNKIYQELNKRLGEDGNRGGSLLKRFFSPQDGGTKKLFKAINDYYGVDLAQDATLAKFVMDTLGDTRSRSLLELPPTTATGLAERGLRLAERKLTSPKRVIKRARSKIKS